mgnify:CR=1 FL=1
MKWHCVGTCSGTEPQPGMHHVSLVLEYGGHLFWFDAGETCSHTAHVRGLELLATRAVFISHAHMDHVGGLANLFWTLRKLAGMKGKERDPLAGERVDLFIPVFETWEGVRRILANTEGNFDTSFEICPAGVQEGVIFDKHGVRVTALKSWHLGEPPPGVPWPAFSFAVEAGGKKAVYSGDVRSVEDIAPIIDGSDVLFMETGHHRVEDICGFLSAGDADVGGLCFIHHGRAILEAPDAELAKARAILGERIAVRIACDGDIVELK